MNPTVSSFYTKNPEEGYIDTYGQQHGDRLDKLVEHYKLADLKGIRVADVGGGLGFLGKRLDPSVDYWVFDGAEYPVEKRVCKGTWVQADIQRDEFGKGWIKTSQDEPLWIGGSSSLHDFDLSMCLETLEHLSDPYHCLVQMKAMTAPGAPIILSIPTETVTHNTIYPSLLWPRQNWEMFLAQMALPITDFWTYEPAPGKGWPAYHYRCINAPWTESRMVFPKAEPKFKGVTPLEATNL